jgi:hypothetical protein
VDRFVVMLWSLTYAVFVVIVRTTRVLQVQAMAWWCPMSALLSSVGL